MTHTATPTRTTAAPPLTFRVVWPKDANDKHTCAAPRCRALIADLDVVAITSRGAAHIQCVPARDRVVPSGMLDTDTEAQCWYAAETPAACPFPIEKHNLCADHHGQLCADGKKPRQQR